MPSSAITVLRPDPEDQPHGCPQPAGTGRGPHRVRAQAPPAAAPDRPGAGSGCRRPGARVLGPRSRVRLWIRRRAARIGQARCRGRGREGRRGRAGVPPDEGAAGRLRDPAGGDAGVPPGGLRGRPHRPQRRRQRAGGLALCWPGDQGPGPGGRRREGRRRAADARGHRHGPGAERLPGRPEQSSEAAGAAEARPDHRGTPAGAVPGPRGGAEGLSIGAERRHRRPERSQDGGGGPRCRAEPPAAPRQDRRRDRRLREERPPQPARSSSARSAPVSSSRPRATPSS
jgi:hypothetical protein